MGNPTTYKNEDLYWNYGRLLTRYGDNNFQYGADNIRYKKNNTVYTLDGSTILKETDGTKTITYYYGNGGVIGFNYNGADYYFEKNLQGDVIALLDKDGYLVAEYVYDAWGKILLMKDKNGNDISNNTSHIGYINPIRYRSYYYDVETNLYYLESRYYDPETGRFLNADSLSYLGEGSDLQNYNLYSYCENNPVMYCDPTGHALDTVLDIFFLCLDFNNLLAGGWKDWKNWVGLGMDIVFTALPFMSADVGKIFKVGNKIDNAVDVANAINKIDNLQEISKITLIGRNMERVRDTATLIGRTDDLYDMWQGFNKVKELCKPLGNVISVIDNFAWMVGKLRKNFTVIDIGITTLHKWTGWWYGVEQLAIGLWKTRNAWKFIIHHYI